MLDTIFVSLSGMNGFSKGLRSISNNVANMNTPGFKRQKVLFEELYSNNLPQRDPRDGVGNGQLGYGVNAFSTVTDFAKGDTRQTGGSLDMAISGEGFFVLQAPDGELRYTRAGQFDFDADGTLINKSDKSIVLGTSGGDGNLMPISLQDLTTSPAKATGSVRFSGTLSSTGTEHDLTVVRVYDRNGTEHLLSMKFTNQGATRPGEWDVKLLDGLTTVGTATLTFVDGRLTPASAKLSMNYVVPGMGVQPLELDFSQGVTSFATGTSSTLAVSNQDGYAAGNATDVTFDAAGSLSVAYSNGQSTRGGKIALARFDSTDVLTAVGASQFVASSTQGRRIGNAREAGFGVLGTGQIENSNVDLSQEFSDLVIMQRGYQASSQTVSTANDMIQSLFDMKGRR